MKIEEAVKLSEDLQEEGYEAKINEQYSGRGMMGKTTVAVVSDKRFDSKKFRSDNLGKRFVYY